MPYITKERAHDIDTHDGIYTYGMENKGELNFAITILMTTYLRRKGKSYQNISDVIAAAQDAADEMKRRVLALYEDAKRSDVNNIDPYVDL